MRLLQVQAEQLQVARHERPRLLRGGLPAPHRSRVEAVGELDVSARARPHVLPAVHHTPRRPQILADQVPEEGGAQVAGVPRGPHRRKGCTDERRPRPAFDRDGRSRDGRRRRHHRARGDARAGQVRARRLPLPTRRVARVQPRDPGTGQASRRQSRRGRGRHALVLRRRRPRRRGLQAWRRVELRRVRGGGESHREGAAGGDEGRRGARRHRRRRFRLRRNRKPGTPQLQRASSPVVRVEGEGWRRTRKKHDEDERGWIEGEVRFDGESVSSRRGGV